MSEQPINDGGSAFPHETSHGYDSGMSIRDYFAAAALQGIVSDPSLFVKSKRDVELVSRSAYEFADAMLKARGDK
jgi:hypothetical protein